MDEQQKEQFLQFCDSLLNFMRRNGWYGACHATTAMMYAFARKIGIDATPCIGECEIEGFKPFDHSWLLIDGKIYDLAISMPFVPETARGPVYESIDIRTEKETKIRYGIYSTGLGPDASFAYGKNLYDYLHGCPKPNLISVLSDLAKYSKVLITRKWLEQNLSEAYFVLRKNGDGNKDQDICEKILSKVNALFGKVFAYNERLLLKCNDKNYSPTYDEVFDFYITSHAISFLKNLYYQYIESPGIFLNARCIIEGLAMKAAHRNGYFGSVDMSLLRNEAPLIERRQYKRFQDSIGSNIIPNDIKEKADKALEAYRNALPDADKSELKRIANSQIPFICNPVLSFQKIIKDNLGDGWSRQYSILSFMVHPSSNERKDTKDHLSLLFDTLEILKKEYSGHPNELDLKKYSFLVLSSKDAEDFIGSVKSECAELESVIAVFEKNFGDNYVSNTFHAISMTVQEMAFDTVFGFSEQTKSKWKVLIELLSIFYEVYLNSENVQDYYELLKIHDNASVARCYGLENGSNSFLDDAYKLYKSMFPNGVGKEEFVKTFERTTGYTIDGNGKTKSLTQLVSQLADLFNDKDTGISYGHSIRLHYAESQMVSHANGYLWYANTGAWSDVNGLFYLFNEIMSTICFCMSGLFKESYKEHADESSKEIAEILEKAARSILGNTESLHESLSKRTGTFPPSK